MADKVIVKNRNGVEIDCTEIHDLWEIAMTLPARQQAQVLDVWHQAHAMLQHIKREEEKPLLSDVEMGEEEEKE